VEGVNSGKTIPLKKWRMSVSHRMVTCIRSENGANELVPFHCLQVC
jgi:hypothetical protein